MIDPDYRPGADAGKPNHGLYPIYRIEFSGEFMDRIDRRKVFDFVAGKLEESIPAFAARDYGKLSASGVSTMNEVYRLLDLKDIENQYAKNPQLQKHVISNVGDFLDSILSALEMPYDEKGMLESMKFTEHEMGQYINPSHFEPYSEVGMAMIGEYGSLLRDFLTEPNKETFARASERKLDLILGANLVKRTDSGILPIKGDFNPTEHIVNLYLP